MQKLNLPTYNFKLKNSQNKTLIFDKLRKKYVVLTPEEWVRQHFVHFLIDQKKYPETLIAIEKQLTINNLKKRTDILIFNSDGKPEVVIECKAPSIKISQKTFDQIARYNMTLKTDLLVVTNGIQHYICIMDHQNKRYHFLKEIPKATFLGWPIIKSIGGKCVDDYLTKDEKYVISKEDRHPNAKGHIQIAKHLHELL